MSLIENISLTNSSLARSGTFPILDNCIAEEFHTKKNKTSISENLQNFSFTFHKPFFKQNFVLKSFKFLQKRRGEKLYSQLKYALVVFYTSRFINLLPILESGGTPFFFKIIFRIIPGSICKVLFFQW